MNAIASPKTKKLSKPSPPAQLQEVSVKVAEFAASGRGKQILRYEGPKVRPDVMVSLNVRISEPVHLKLEEVEYRKRLDNKMVTKRSLVERALLEYVDRELKKYGLPV